LKDGAQSLFVIGQLKSILPSKLRDLVRYRFGSIVTYVTRSGKVLDEATVRTRVKVGIPVRVHYAGTAPDLLVDRVILEED
jgi:hypothetical protein